MAALSLRTALSNVGEPKSGASIMPIPSGCASTPGKSLKALVETMMLSPQPEQWAQASEGFHDEHWTEECQGVTWDGSHFVFSANDAGKPGSHPRAIYRFLGNGDVHTILELDGKYGNHLGALDFHDGKLYCAMEGPLGFLVVNAGSGAVIERTAPKSASGGAPPQTANPWCAVNPWNGLLYSSDYGDTTPITVVHAYDPAKGYRNVPSADIHLRRGAFRVQGGCFSTHGHLYLATDQRDGNDPKFRLIRAYSIINGAYLGFARVLAQEDDQELEDVCYAPMTLGGAAVQIHALLLENVGSLDSDNIFFKHFSAPVPSAV